jgi:hypothetical protein
VSLKTSPSTVNKFDDFSFRVKSWFITLVVAITGYAISKNEPEILYLNYFIVVIFYLYEVTYRISQGDFLRRLREVQSILRGELSYDDKNKSPNLDKYLFDTEEIPSDALFLKFQKRFKIEEDRAKRNVRELRMIRSRSWKYLFQFRISLLYLLILISNSLLLIFS